MKICIKLLLSAGVLALLLLIGLPDSKLTDSPKPVAPHSYSFDIEEEPQASMCDELHGKDICWLEAEKKCKGHADCEINEECYVPDAKAFGNKSYSERHSGGTSPRPPSGYCIPNRTECQVDEQCPKEEPYCRDFEGEKSCLDFIPKPSEPYECPDHLVTMTCGQNHPDGPVEVCAPASCPPGEELEYCDNLTRSPYCRSPHDCFVVHAVLGCQISLQSFVIPFWSELPEIDELVRCGPDPAQIQNIKETSFCIAETQVSDWLAPFHWIAEDSCREVWHTDFVNGNPTCEDALCDLIETHGGCNMVSLKAEVHTKKIPCDCPFDYSRSNQLR